MARAEPMTMAADNSGADLIAVPTWPGCELEHGKWDG